MLETIFGQFKKKRKQSIRTGRISFNKDIGHGLEILLLHYLVPFVNSIKRYRWSYFVTKHKTFIRGPGRWENGELRMKLHNDTKND